MLQVHAREMERERNRPGICFGTTEFRYNFGSSAVNNCPDNFFRYAVCKFYKNQLPKTSFPGLYVFVGDGTAKVAANIALELGAFFSSLLPFPSESSCFPSKLGKKLIF